MSGFWYCLYMLERIIKLKRNMFILQLWVYFPLVILFCCGGCLIHYIGIDDWDKIFLAIGFVIQLIIAVKVFQSNDYFIKFSEKEIGLYKCRKSSPILLRSFAQDAIKNVVCNGKRKTIKVVMYNGLEEFLLKFNFTDIIGEEAYFRIKAELCRYYPAKTQNIRDEYVVSYLENDDVIPEYIQSKQKVEVCQATVILFFELIFAIVPVGLTILSVAWAICGIWIFILKVLVLFLNLFLK